MRNAVVKQRSCRLHELHVMAFAISISTIWFSFTLLPSLSFSIGCMLELFALKCLLFTTSTLASNDSLTPKKSPCCHLICINTCTVGCWFLSDVFISKRKTVMWLLWIHQMVFDSPSTTNAMHCIQTTEYTCHTRCRDGDNDANSNSNSRMQVPISKSAYK